MPVGVLYLLSVDDLQRRASGKVYSPYPQDKRTIDQDELAYHNEPFTKEDYAEAAIDILKHQFLVIERNSLLEEEARKRLLLSSSSGWAGLIVTG
jgi:hypothetical protein